MNYAIVENGVVTNIIWINPNDVKDFPNAVCCQGKPVSIGDTYNDGEFYDSNNNVIITYEKMMLDALNKANQTIVELDAALLEETYQSIMGGIE
jgi:hypothetical protein